MNPCSERKPLFVITGAPGSGKSAAVEAFAARRTEFVAFDIDWIMASASGLAGKDIRVNPSTWPAYNAVWFDILRGVSANGRVPVLFAPWNRGDLAVDYLPGWCDEVRFLLLDCDDEIRRARLLERPGWTESMIQEALEDAAVLRSEVAEIIDTDGIKHSEVAVAVLVWLKRETG